ncbi:hypothetical protein [Nostoc sp. DedQUE09]|uniref:hypothetical protein n=1 Tax=Nostoc sp. DedQUE09 TaxID=3075394 RepID=UPI002AD3B6B8|nr:hypothetical protein [Nostoc sp. DedQUE09]MDZ7955178.1 hypothetical protein [Nostoc sp. DedQUE09]
MSNIEGFTPNHLLQQVYGTTVLDENVDVELNDEELELIAGPSIVAKSYRSDVIVGNRRIISLNEVLYYEKNHEGLIQLIKNRFGRHITDIAARELSQQLRHQAPRVGKAQHQGFIFNLRSGKLCYLDTPGCTIKWVLS